jgi:hypothetical protein
MLNARRLCLRVAPVMAYIWPSTSSLLSSERRSMSMYSSGAKRRGVAGMAMVLLLGGHLGTNCTTGHIARRARRAYHGADGRRAT